MRPTCVVTVVELRNRRSASSALLRPVASRRSTINARKAMLLRSDRTITLMQELAAAINEDRDPRTIDTDNEPVDGTVARWGWGRWTVRRRKRLWSVVPTGAV